MYNVMLHVEKGDLRRKFTYCNFEFNICYIRVFSKLQNDILVIDIDQCNQVLSEILLEILIVFFFLYLLSVFTLTKFLLQSPPF